MGSVKGPLTTHVLNTGDGVPAARMALSLHRLDPHMTVWSLVTIGTTNEDGRCPGLITSDAFTPGMYKIRFETGQYWESLGQSSFYPYVEIVFTVSAADQSVHVPLLVSRYSYSTYRGAREHTHCIQHTVLEFHSSHYGSEISPRASTPSDQLSKPHPVVVCSIFF